MDEVPIIIVSHKRPNKVLTTKHVTGCKISVPDSQAKEYEKQNPDAEIVAHPDSIKGLSPKRNWLYKQYGDLIMIDDDLTGLHRNYIGYEKDRPVNLTPDEANAVLNDVYRNAKEAGAKLFGLCQTANPGVFGGQNPIHIGAFVTGGCLGMVWDENLYFPEDYPNFVGEDIWINLLNAYYNRYQYVDMRFSVSYADTEKGTGGCADYRTEQERKKTFMYLKRHFGDAIVRKNKGNPKFRKIKSKWERQANISFW